MPIRNSHKKMKEFRYGDERILERYDRLHSDFESSNLQRAAANSVLVL